MGSLVRWTGVMFAGTNENTDVGKNDRGGRAPPRRTKRNGRKAGK